MGGASPPDAPASGEQGEEVAAVSPLAANVRPDSSPSAPLAEPRPPLAGLPPLSSQVEIDTGTKDGLDLRAIEKQLAISLGPIARFIVEKAAAKAKNQEELLAQIASTISSPHDREAFLAKKKQFACTPPPGVQKVKAAAAGTGESMDTSVPQGGSELNPADIGKAAELAARYLGPISRILAERAARRADSLQGLYMILAGHLKENERAQFLGDAGYPES
jgi:serine/threonine-protein kinase